MTTMIICGASRGKYGEPLTFPEAYKGELPRTACCDRCEKRYRIESLRVSRWELTPQEKKEAVRDFDMFSLDMPDKVLCLKCSDKEVKGEQER